jgi:hypothetical protein
LPSLALVKHVKARVTTDNQITPYIHTIVGYEGGFLGTVLTLIFTPVYARVRSALLGSGNGAFAPARLVEVFGRPVVITWLCGEGGKGEEGDDGKDGEFHLRWQRCE